MCGDSKNELRETFARCANRPPGSGRLLHGRTGFWPVGWTVWLMVDAAHCRAACAFRVDCRFICSPTENGPFDKTDT
jgi:hypothetical protein